MVVFKLNKVELKTVPICRRSRAVSSASTSLEVARLDGFSGGVRRMSSIVTFGSLYRTSASYGVYTERVGPQAVAQISNPSVVFVNRVETPQTTPLVTV